MKLYHGSPKKVKALIPRQAKGLNKFENQIAIYLCKTFNQAALYAIGKTLKGKTGFAPLPNKLIIIGNLTPKAGYVYEVNVDAKKGSREQFMYNKSIRKYKVKKVYPKDYENKIIRVKSKKELFNLAK